MPKSITQNTLFYGDNLLIGNGIDMPPSVYGTLQQAEKVKKSDATQDNLK
jgi:hypothetical protein